MTYDEFTALDPFLKIENVDRTEVKTLYSVSHYDGPMTGVAEWRGKRYYCRCPSWDMAPRKYLLIEIDPDKEKILEDATRRYAETNRATGPLMREIYLEVEEKGQIVGYFHYWSNDDF
jgi:hypothetical protein